MKPTFLLLIAICMSVFAIPSCKKTPPPEPDNPWGLPNATQEGKNIFACRVNGENWIAEDMFNSPTKLFWRDSALFFYGDQNGSNFNITVEKRKIQTETNYILNDTLNSFAGFLGVWHKCETIGFIKLSKSYEGELLITKINTSKKYVSGTFHYKIIIPNCDTMNITDGRFDINYY